MYGLLTDPMLCNLVLWPARATTKKSLAALRHPLAVPAGRGVPERGGGNGADCGLNYLATATSPVGRKHRHVLQIRLYY